MTISTLLTPELVIPALAARAKAEVLEALAAHVGRVHPHVDVRRLTDALHERERQSPTALQDGVAIEFGAVDGRPTQLFLLLVVSVEQPGGHLKLLAGAARLLSDARCRTRLLEAGTAADLVAVLREHEARANPSLHAA